MTLIICSQIMNIELSKVNKPETKSEQFGISEIHNH
jgi:hypothetical protein